MLNTNQNKVEKLMSEEQALPKGNFETSSLITPKIKSFCLRYGLALGIILITLLISAILSFYSIKINLTILVIIALIIPSWYGGRGPGFLVGIVFEIVTIFSRPIPPPNTTIEQFIFERLGIIFFYVILVLLVSSRRRVEKGLRESEERYRHLFENNPFPMWVYDLETFNFLAVNDAAVFYYGYSREEFLTMTMKEIRPPSEIPAFLKEVAETQDRIINTGIWKHRKKDGTVIDTEISSHELVFNGRLSRLILANDVTKRKKAEDSLRELNETLEQRVTERTSELEAANKELEAFSYSVSHDLRSPLRAVDGFTRIIIEDYGHKLDDEAKRLFDVICQNAQNMGRLIDDLLEFSRLGRKQIEPTLIDMGQLTQDVCRQIEPSILPTQNLRIEELPEISGDKALLRQVFINLILNALKYSRTKENALVEIGGRTEEEENIYYIRDNGVGFNMQYYGKLFGVFQRLHTQDEFEGTGVGLAIVQRIIHRHGGRVWAEAEINKGATFYFALPLNYPNQKEISHKSQ
jgi:PAS domain S-box-containing protein